MTKLLQVSCSPDRCSKSVGSSPLAYQMLSRSHFLPSCGDDWIFTLSLSSFLCHLKGSEETKKEDTQCNPEHAYQLSICITSATIGLLRKPLASLTETGHPANASINIMCSLQMHWRTIQVKPFSCWWGLIFRYIFVWYMTAIYASYSARNTIKQKQSRPAMSFIWKKNVY